MANLNKITSTRCGYCFYLLLFNCIYCVGCQSTGQNSVSPVQRQAVLHPYDSTEAARQTSDTQSPVVKYNNPEKMGQQEGINNQPRLDLSLQKVKGTAQEANDELSKETELSSRNSNVVPTIDAQSPPWQAIPLALTEKDQLENQNQIDFSTEDMHAKINVSTSLTKLMSENDISKQNEQQNLQLVRQIVNIAQQSIQNNPNYTCRLTRQERDSLGRMPDPEVLLMNFLATPRCLSMYWLDEKNEGRACIYREGHDNGNMVMRGGKGDLFFKNKRMVINPNGIFAQARSKYKITEAGMANSVARIHEAVALVEQGDRSQGVPICRGLVSRPELSQPVVLLEQVKPPKADPKFPQGATIRMHLDLALALPVLVETSKPSGELLDYFLFEHFLPNETLTPDDFDPDLLGWPK